MSIADVSLCRLHAGRIEDKLPYRGIADKLHHNRGEGQVQPRGGEVRNTQNPVDGHISANGGRGQNIGDARTRYGIERQIDARAAGTLAVSAYTPFPAMVVKGTAVTRSPTEKTLTSSPSASTIPTASAPTADGS